MQRFKTFFWWTVRFSRGRTCPACGEETMRVNPPLLMAPFHLLLFGRGSYRRCRRCLRSALHLHAADGARAAASGAGLEALPATPPAARRSPRGEMGEDGEFDLWWRLHLQGDADDPEAREKKRAILQEVERASLRAGDLPPAYLPRLMDEVDRGAL
jgi:hypothetical protein